MGFDFLIPQGFRPIALYVKNVRSEVPENDPKVIKFASAAVRDGWIKGGMEGGGGGGSNAGQLDMSQVVKVETKARGSETLLPTSGITVSNNIGFVIQKGSERGLEVGDDNHVLDGEERFNKTELNNRGIDQKLRVDKFSTT